MPQSRPGSAGSSAEIPRTLRLSRSDWPKFCTSLGLTVSEAERLFEVLAGDSGRAVDFHDMFSTLRTTVSPNVSLERFATKVLARFGSLHSAFVATCGQPQVPGGPRVMPPLMRWQEFHALAAAVDVNDGNASQLWALLLGALFGDTVAVMDADGAGTVSAITEEAFVQQVSVWAPGSALDTLKGQFYEHFGSLAESRRALRKKGGFKCGRALSAPTLEAGLQAVGINCCNADRIIDVAAKHQRGRSRDAGASLNDVLSAMRKPRSQTASAAPGGSSQPAGARRQRHDTTTAVVCDGMASVWRQLHEVRDELRLGPPGCAESGDGAVNAGGVSGAPVKRLTPPQLPR